MAEMAKGVTAGKLASSMQKKFTRAQEKVLQKLGKADETKDAAFEEVVTQFNKQMTQGTNLQKDLRAYLAAVKAMHDSSRRLQECLADMYEPEWYGKEEVTSIAEDTDLLWIDFHQKLVDQASQSMDTYMGQFPDIKARIAKRDRKLVDFDSARHNVASTQKSKKKDEVKLAKSVALLEKAAPVWAQGMISAHHVAQTNLSRNQAEDELGRAQKVFEEMNVELQDELPALWNSRVGFYVNTFQSVASLSEKFHREMGKLNQSLNEVMTKLEEQNNDQSGANHNIAQQESPIHESESQEFMPGPPRPPQPTTNRVATSPSQPEQTPVETEQWDDSACATAQSGWDDEGAHTAQSGWDDEEARTAQSGWDDEGAHTAQSGWDDEEARTAQSGWDDEGARTAQSGWDDEEARTAQSGWDDEGARTAQSGWDDEGARTAQSGWDDEGAHTAQSGWDDEGARTAQSGWDDDATQIDAETERQEAAEGGCTEGDGEYPNEDQSGSAGAAEAEFNSLPAAANAEESPVATTNGSSEEVEMPPRFLFKVKAMHDYIANDADELEMKSGDIVLVVSYENPDEQDDGWLMGMLESSWIQSKGLAHKGVFPENFTQNL